jgi:O-antigen/teichoic acid export membrane protein
VRNVAVVASGTAGAQAITIAFSPIITRLYGPEAFGLLGTFMAIVAVVTPIAALSYPIAIVLPKKDSDARGIAKLSAYIAVIIAAVLFLLFIIAGDWLVGILRVQEISAFILLIPLVIVFTAFMQIAQQWLIRKKQFQITSRAAVFHALTINSLKSGIGLIKPVAAVLISLAAIGNAIHAGLLAWGARKYEREYQERIDSTQARPSLWKLAKKHYDFPLFRAPQNFINSVSQNLPVLMLAAFFGPASAGFYALCRRLLGLPSQLIGKSVGDVFYPRITEAAHRGEDLTRLILKATLSLAAIGIVPFGMIVAFGPWLFGFVFGSEWVIAGVYARWLALMMFFNFVNRPAVVSVPVLDIQKGLLFYEFFSTGSKLLAMYIGFVIFNNDITVVALFGVFGAIAYIMLISWVIFSSFSKQNRRNHA